MLFDSIPYIILFIFCALNIRKNTKSSNEMVFFVLFVFSALRCDVGYDYMGYSHTIKYGSEFEVNRLEIGERWLLLISRQYFPQLFFIVNSFISVFFTKKALEKLSPNVSISALVFLCFPNMYLNSMGVVRFWSAIAIVFYASTFLHEKKYIYYCIFQIIALLFHNAAIVGLFFVPLYLFRIPYWVNYAILAFGFIGGELVLGEILSGILPTNAYSDQLIRYAEIEVSESGMSKIPYFYLILDIILLIGFRRLRKSEIFYKSLTIFNVGVAAIFLFSFQTTLSLRMSLPFLVYILILAAYVVKEPSKVMDYKSKNLIFIILSFALMMYAIMIINATLGRSQYLPYKLFFL